MAVDQEARDLINSILAEFASRMDGGTWGVPADFSILVRQDQPPASGSSQFKIEDVPVPVSSMIARLASGDIVSRLFAEVLTDIGAAASGHNHDSTYLRLDGGSTPTSDIPFGTNKLTGVADPTATDDAATKNYVDGLVNGLVWKNAVKCASTANLTLSTGFVSGQVIDGYTLVLNDRILVKDQTAGAENGIRVVADSGAPARSTDADSAAEVSSGMSCHVGEGTLNGDKNFVLTTDGTIVIDTTALAFTESFSGVPNDTLVAGKLHASQTDIFFGRDTTGAGAGEEITMSAAKVLLDLTGTNSGDEPDATTTVKGIVELATDGETASSKAVQGNDSRLLKNKLDATVDPAATDDSGSGYGVGSKWINVTADVAFICVDATSTAAIWLKIAPQTMSFPFDWLTAPVVGQTIGIYIDEDITLTEVVAECDTGTPTLTLSSRALGSRWGTDAEVHTTGIAPVTGSQTLTSFSGAGGADVDKNQWLVLKVVAITGAPQTMTITVMAKKRKP